MRQASAEVSRAMEAAFTEVVSQLLVMPTSELLDEDLGWSFVEKRDWAFLDAVPGWGISVVVEPEEDAGWLTLRLVMQARRGRFGLRGVQQVRLIQVKVSDPPREVRWLQPSD